MGNGADCEGLLCYVDHAFVGDVCWCCVLYLLIFYVFLA